MGFLKIFLSMLKYRVNWKLYSVITAVVAAFCGIESRTCRAAPVTFAFDAQITTVFQSDTGFEFPFEASVGDTIRGRFSFEPSPLGKIGPQDLGIQFDIADLLLQSPTYEIALSRNLPPPLGSEDIGLIDTISVACSFLSTRPQCSPGTVPGRTDIRWRLSMQLGGESPILSSFDLIGDPDIWNSFTGRSLELDFFTPGVGGGFVGAIVGPINAVPEPNPRTTMALLMFSLLTHRFSMRHFF